MPGQFGWTAASLIPINRVSAGASTNTGGPGSQTFTPAQVPQLDVTKNMQSILQKILGPNYTQGQNPSPIAGSAALFSPNYLAQARAGTLPAASNPAAPGFTQFGNSFWKMPAQAPANTEALPGVNQNAFAPAPTGGGGPSSAWVSNQQNLFNI